MTRRQDLCQKKWNEIPNASLKNHFYVISEKNYVHPKGRSRCKRPTSLIGLVYSLLSAVDFQESHTYFLLLSFIFNGGVSFALFSTKDFNGFCIYHFDSSHLLLYYPLYSCFASRIICLYRAKIENCCRYCLSKGASIISPKNITPMHFQF